MAVGVVHHLASLDSGASVHVASRHEINGYGTDLTTHRINIFSVTGKPVKRFDDRQHRVKLSTGDKVLATVASSDSSKFILSIPQLISNMTQVAFGQEGAGVRGSSSMEVWATRVGNLSFLSSDRAHCPDW